MDAALINGMYARIAGPAQGRTLVLLHAFADSGLSFTPLFDTPLGRRFHLVAVDLAGFGASPRQATIGTISQHAESVAAFIRALPATGSVGLIAHSMTSMIAVEAARRLGGRFGGLFSVEGNLTAEDAYFSGRAADFDDPDAFKRQFLDGIWALAQTKPIFRRYFATVLAADPIAMWDLGRDARRVSVDDGPGRNYRSVHPTLYYWSAESTSETSRRWLERSGLDHRRFTNASHWPMIDQPEATAQAIETFYDGL